MASGHFVDLREIARRSPAREFVNRFPREILPPANVDGFEPALFAPSPGRAGRHACIGQPLPQADNRPPCRAICFYRCIRFHAPTCNPWQRFKKPTARHPGVSELFRRLWATWLRKGKPDASAELFKPLVATVGIGTTEDTI